MQTNINILPPSPLPPSRSVSSVSEKSNNMKTGLNGPVLIYHDGFKFNFSQVDNWVCIVGIETLYWCPWQMIKDGGVFILHLFALWEWRFQGNPCGIICRIITNTHNLASPLRPLLDIRPQQSFSILSGSLPSSLSQGKMLFLKISQYCSSPSSSLSLFLLPCGVHLVAWWEHGPSHFTSA